MNTKRWICLALATLLALLPLITLAAGEKYVKNTGREPVGIFAAIGDRDPVRTLAPGKQEKWLDEETVDGVLWYRVKDGYIMADLGIEVVEPTAEPDLISALTVDSPTAPPQGGAPEQLPEIQTESHGTVTFDPARQGSGSEPTPAPIIAIADPSRRPPPERPPPPRRRPRPRPEAPAPPSWSSTRPTSIRAWKRATPTATGLP